MGARSIFSWVTTVAILSLSWSATVFAEELPKVIDTEKPSIVSQTIAKLVIQDVSNYHILSAKQKIDDNISRRAFQHFLKDIDPRKEYLRKSDIEEFMKEQDRIDDMVKKGDVSFAYTVYKRYLQRVQELTPVIHELIDAPHDFTVDEKIIIDRKAMEYAADAAEARERWRRTIKYNLLTMKADRERAAKQESQAKQDNQAKPEEKTVYQPEMPKTDAEAREKLHRRFNYLAKARAQMDVYELLELYLTAVTTSLDPHTTYMAPRAKDNFEMIMGLRLEGIGAQLSPDDGVTTVASIVAGGAADKDGRLKPGDQIIAVAQEGDAKPVDVVDMKLDDVVSMIRGPANTKVYLTVKSKVGGEPKVIDITRAKIQLEESAARSVIIEHGLKPNGQAFKVGYIDLPSFYVDMQAMQNRVANYRSTTRDMEVILRNFREKGVDAVVLNLSDNGGGSLTEAISCTGLFIDKGPVVQVKKTDGTVANYDDPDPGVAWSGPLVVMTTKKSASASEIFAGAIKDYQRGIIVGDPTTHGKGTVQTVLDIGEQRLSSRMSQEFGALKVTIQQFFLPDGKSTQRDGVQADIILPSIWANLDIGESDLDYALPTDKVKARPHQDYHMVTSSMIAKLNQDSAKRIQASSEFDKLLKRIETYKRQKDEKYASLVESDFMARRAEISAEEEEEKQLLDSQVTKQQIFIPNFYNQEILNITKDYFEALQNMSVAKAG